MDSDKATLKFLKAFGTTYMITFILNTAPVPAIEKQHQCMMQPLPEITG